MGKEIEDIEFDELLADKRHKEITVTLGRLATAISQPKEDKGIADAIKASTQATAGLIQAVKELPKPEKPEVNVEMNSKDFVTSVQQAAKDIVESNEKVIQALENRPLVDKFEFSYDYGNIKTANVIYKK